MKHAIATFRRDAGQEVRQAAWRPAIVEELVPQAGLTVDRSFDTTWAYEYADSDAVADAMLAAGGARAAAGAGSEAELRAAILRALARYRQPDGGYRLSNEWHVVIALA